MRPWTRSPSRQQQAEGVTVAIEPKDADADADDHQVSLAVGENTITVVATSVDKETTRTYTVKVTRISASDASLSDLSLEGATLSPAFSSGTTAYTASVANDDTETMVTATATNSGVTATVIPGGTVNLATGDNIIRVVVASVDGTQTKTYTVTVTKAGSDDATLSELTLLRRQR